MNRSRSLQRVELELARNPEKENILGMQKMISLLSALERALNFYFQKLNLVCI